MEVEVGRSGTRKGIGVGRGGIEVRGGHSDRHAARRLFI